MKHRTRSSARWFLIGILVLAVLIATSLTFVLGSTAETSGVLGTVTSWPCEPVESGVGARDCPGHYGEIRVLRPDHRVVAVSHTDRNGRFRIELSPGRFIIDPGDDGKSIANGAGRVTVREGQFSRVDLTYYTGLL